MRIGKLRDEWDRTASLMSLYISAHSKHKAPKPDELNPYRNAPKQGIKKKMAMEDYLKLMAENTAKRKGLKHGNQ